MQAECSAYLHIRKADEHWWLKALIKSTVHSDILNLIYPTEGRRFIIAWVSKLGNDHMI